MIDHLQKAKDNKNDEFYTQLEDIEKELAFYKPCFEGKIVLCNCDDPFYSDFYKYFFLHFRELKLKKLLVTHYDTFISPNVFEYRGETDSFLGYGKKLEGNGDFRNPENIEILKEADIVVTNPPFSLFKEFVDQLMEYDKKFLIIGSLNAITYKNIFNYIREGKLWLGHNHGAMTFIVPGYINPTYRATLGNIEWFTNLDTNERHESLKLNKHYDPELYPTYDNYNAINVNKVSDIPKDYTGIMGVPITYLTKHNPDDFEILGITRGYVGDFRSWAVPAAYPIKKYANSVQHKADGTIIKKDRVNTRATILRKTKPEGKDYYTADNADGFLEIVYARILIRMKVK